MAIEWPESIRPSRQSFGVNFNNFVQTSVLSNAQAVYGHPGAFWTCSMTFNILSAQQERVLTSFLGQLQGMVGTFKLPAWTRQRDDDIGSPRVGTANAQASTMTVSGLKANVQAFSVGDYITVQDEMYEIVADVKATASGTATLRLNKRLRGAITTATTIEYRRPYSVMRLTTPDYQVARQQITASGSFECREAF